jgi:DNA-binding NarL/FixJ family response regulator
VRIVIGDDELLLREGLMVVLRHGDFQVVATARDGAELVRYATELSPDLVVTDIRMPPGFTDEGLRAALDVRRAMPHVAIVVLTQHLQRQYVRELLRRRNRARP